jgi:hypothetical protein
MARGCYGRFKKAKCKKTARKQARLEEIGETELRGRKHTKGCSAK